jgi:hypothetical protein
MKRRSVNQFLHYLNSLCPSIQFTVEHESDTRTLAFLDCNVSWNNYHFVTQVHHKPTQSDRYLNFDSAHPLSMKRSVIRTLVHRAEQICSDPSSTEREVLQLRTTLGNNGYPDSFITHALRLQNSGGANPETNPVDSVRIPYRQHTSENIRRVLSNFNIRTSFQMDNTLHKQLVRTKDPIKSEDKTNCVYRINCADCSCSYIGQTSRQLKVRVNEHKRHVRAAPRNARDLNKLERDSAIALHALTEGHRIDFDGVHIVEQNLNTHARRCCAESLAIHMTPGCVNRSDSVELSAIWSGLIHHQKAGQQRQLARDLRAYQQPEVTTSASR